VAHRGPAGDAPRAHREGAARGDGDVRGGGGGGEGVSGDGSSSHRLAEDAAGFTLVVVAVHSHVKLDEYVPELRTKLGMPLTVVRTMRTISMIKI
jgi:hypothetical protein